MPNIVKERVSAHVEGGFVVFLIGMRINTLWKVYREQTRVAGGEIRRRLYARRARKASARG